jgi:hypothetical protein
MTTNSHLSQEDHNVSHDMFYVHCLRLVGKYNASEPEIEQVLLLLLLLLLLQIRTHPHLGYCLAVYLHTYSSALRNQLPLRSDVSGKSYPMEMFRPHQSSSVLDIWTKTSLDIADNHTIVFQVKKVHLELR